MSVALTSCGNDCHDPDIELSGNVEKYFPSYCVNLSVFYNVSNKYFQMTAGPRFYFDPSEWNVKIEKVDYYLDDKYIKSSTITPFSIEYESNNWLGGSHTVRADITISGNDIETFVLQATKVIGSSSSQEIVADIWFDYNYVTTGNEFFISGNINYNRSAKGISIKSFSAKWDDINIGEKLNEPYKLTRIVNEKDGTSHAVSATLIYMQGDIERSCSFSLPSYEICGPNSIMQTFSLKSGYSNYKNGEVLNGIARQFIGSDVKATYELNLYLDSNLIGSSKTFPYELSYKLENMQLGDHTIKKLWIRYNEYGIPTSSYSTDEIITITK